MVRNEQDVIEPVIRHLFAEGLDWVLVADNLSSDDTRSILDRLARELPVIVVDDFDPAFHQSEKMTALARRAGASGADWVLPFDADELWVNNEGTLREGISEARDADVLILPWFQHYAPLVSLRRDPFRRMAVRDTKPNGTKIAFRYRPDAVIAIGNHYVTADEPLRESSDHKIEVHHYRYRGFRQMIAKSRQGAKALDLAGQPLWAAYHWRRHAGHSVLRLVVTWLWMSAPRKSRIRDLRLPSS